MADDPANTAEVTLVTDDAPLPACDEMTSVLSARMTSRMVGGAPVCEAVESVWRSAAGVVVNPSTAKICVARASH